MIASRLAAVLLLWMPGPGMAVAGQLPSFQVDPAPESSDDEEAAMSDLLAVIEDASALATKTYMNADFVPGILTVLHGNELVALGVRTVWEALELVPGVQITRNNFGGQRVSIRGLQHGNGNIKVLLNSVAMNDSYSGYAQVMHIPVEQVQRIEVIRGPGSAVHGEFAFAGVVDIITRKDENRAYLRAGSRDTYEAGAVLATEDRQRDLRVSLNLSGWDTQGADVEAGTDTLYWIGQGSVSRAPGEVDDAENSRLAVFALDHADFSLLAQYTAHERGGFFGALNALPESDDRPDATSIDQWLIQARQEFSLSQHLETELKLSWLRNETNFEDELLPPGTMDPTLPKVLYPDGLRQGLSGRETRWEAELGVRWSGWTDHRWRLDLAAAEVSLDEAWWAFNLDLATGESLPEMRRYTGDQNFIEEGVTRSIHSVALQDQYRLSDHFELTAGLRYDHYSDVGDNLSPRLAGVWRLAEEHTLKLQYAEAFFPPNLLQVYRVSGALPGFDDPPSDAETTATTELGYVFRRDGTVARATLYYSKLKDLIVFENNAYVNRGRVRLQGIETELEHQLGRSWKLAANLSYMDTLDEETDGPLAGAADWLGNLSLFYRLSPDILVTGYWRYVGDRHRSADDPRRDKLAGYNDLALTLNWFNAGASGLTLRAGVKNLLGERIESPAPAYTYRGDYPLLDERTWWVQLSYQLR